MPASSSNANRTAGSTLASGAPPVAPSLGELAGGVPVERALTGERLGQVAEHRQSGEGIGPLLRRVVVGHGPDAMCVARQ